MKVPHNPDNSKEFNKSKKNEQTSSDELTGSRKRTEKEQDKNPGRQAEVVERESPEVHQQPDRDPRVN